MPDSLLACVSGRELVVQGYRQDVETAAGVNASPAGPCPLDGVFGPAAGSRIKS